MKPGLHSMSVAEYHCDPCPAPSLSSGTLRLILAESPLHAWTSHPRLGGGRADWPSARRSMIGSVAHKLALDAGAAVVIIKANDFRTNAAKAERDQAEAAGLIPCLEADYQRAEQLAKPLRAAAEDYVCAPIKDCLLEQVLLWEDGGCWRRALFDLLSPDLLKAADLKTTEASVAPAVCGRRIYDMGYHIQAAHYVAGLDALDPENIARRRFGFIFAEQDKPHAVSPPIEMSEAGWDYARGQVKTGSALWDACLRAGKWPGFGSDVHLAEPPAWALAGWELRMQSDEGLNGPQSINETGWVL